MRSRRVWITRAYIVATSFAKLLTRRTHREREKEREVPEIPITSISQDHTYVDALKNGEEVLELLIEDYQAQGKPLPKPLTANVGFEFVNS